MNNDYYLSNGVFFLCLKMLVDDNLIDIQIQQLNDWTIIATDKNFDGKISYWIINNYLFLFSNI